MHPLVPGMRCTAALPRLRYYIPRSAFLYTFNTPKPDQKKSSPGQDSNLRICQYPACDARLQYEGYGYPSALPWVRSEHIPWTLELLSRHGPDGQLCAAN